MVSRNVVALLLVGLAIGGGVYTDVTPLNDDSYNQSFLSSSIVDEIHFDEDGTMDIVLSDNHNAVCFAIWHNSDDTKNRDPLINYGCSTDLRNLPRYGGTVRIDISGSITNSETNFPSNKFKLIGFDRELFGEPVGRVTFRVPDELLG